MEGKSLKQYALDYLEKGKSIFPVGKDKIPLIAWKEYQTRLPAKEEIEKWWNKWPEANIGGITGEISGQIVVDFEKGSDFKDFPSTLMAQTGNGGWHFYYRYVPNVKNAVRIRPLVDIRSDG